MKVNICGIEHNVIECKDKFDVDCHLGMIDYKKCEIRINKESNAQVKKEVICHEMMHGILFHIGYTDLSNDEQFVQAVANAINQGFDIKRWKNDKVRRNY